MASYHALFSYHFLLNFLVGIFYFIAIYGIGDFVVRFLPYTYPSPLKQVLKTIVGFLSVSLVIQLLAFRFCINQYSLGFITLALILALIKPLLSIIRSNISPIYSFLNASKEGKIGSIYLFLCFLPIFLYAILPSAKIDELFYHQLVAQRIVSDGGMIFYRQPWEAAIPTHLLYNFSQVPLVYWGFPDAANVVSLCIFSLFLGFVLLLFNKIATSPFWKWSILSLLCLGMYRLTFTTAGSHHFGDVAAFMGLYVVAMLPSLKRQISIPAILTMQGVFLAAAAGSKMSLLPYAVLIGIYTLYEVWREDKLKITHVILLLFPLLIFYVPIVVWTYLQTHSPFGLALSEYFDAKLIDKHLLISTLQKETVLHPTLSVHGKEALSYFPFVLLLSPLLFAFSQHPRTLKIKILSLFGLFLTILYAFHLIYNPRFWGNLPASLLVLGALSPPIIKWASVARPKLLIGVFVTIMILPYLALSYYYLYHLFPFPYNEATKEAYYQKFIPLYEDYQALDKLLPADACLFTQNRLNLVHSPRRIFRDSLDICNCSSLYALQCDKPLLPTIINTRNKKYQIGPLIYQNKQAAITIYRTPNKKQKKGVLSVYKLTPL